MEGKFHLFQFQTHNKISWKRKLWFNFAAYVSWVSLRNETRDVCVCECIKEEKCNLIFRKQTNKKLFKHSISHFLLMKSKFNQLLKNFRSICWWQKPSSCILLWSTCFLCVSEIQEDYVIVSSFLFPSQQSHTHTNKYVREIKFSFPYLLKARVVKT